MDGLQSLKPTADEFTGPGFALSIAAIARWHLQQAERYKRLELRAIEQNRIYADSGGMSEYNRRERKARSLYELHMKFAERLLAG